MTHFDTLIEAFVKIGYDFIIHTGDSGYKHVYLCNETDIKDYEVNPTKVIKEFEFLDKQLFEFDKDGNWASY